MIYLDNAATTGKKPPLVINAVNNALKYYCVNPGRSGHSLSIKASEKIYIREIVKLIIKKLIFMIKPNYNKFRKFTRDKNKRSV